MNIAFNFLSVILFNGDAYVQKVCILNIELTGKGYGWFEKAMVGLLWNKSWAHDEKYRDQTQFYHN